MFAYSDEDETEAVGLEAKVPEDVIEARRSRIVDLVDELMEQRAAERIGESVRVLVESVDDGVPCGRAAHQGPDDGACFLVNSDAVVGDWVDGYVVENEGVDLWVRP